VLGNVHEFIALKKQFGQGCRVVGKRKGFQIRLVRQEGGLISHVWVEDRCGDPKNWGSGEGRCFTGEKKNMGKS